MHGLIISHRGSLNFLMKSYSSLFPSYCFRDDDVPVFFELSNTCDLSRTINHTNWSDDSTHVNFTPITGNIELVNILKRAKVVCDSLGRKNFEELRGKTNYYEGLGKGCFLNRSAMKLVNLDYAFSLIEPTVEREVSPLSSSVATSYEFQARLQDNFMEHEMIQENHPSRLHFTFLDLCGGPGGFIECIVLKCRHEGVAVTGFGMTLLIGDSEPGLRGIMKSCNWNLNHLQDPPYSVILSDQKSSLDENSCINYVDIDALITNNDIQDTNRNSVFQNSNLNGPTINFDKNEIKKNMIGKKIGSECRVILVAGVTGTGDICIRENLDSLNKLFEMELPVGCEAEDEKDDEEGEDSRRIGESGKIKKILEHIEGEKKEKKIKNMKKYEKFPKSQKIQSRKFVQFVCSDGFDHETEAFRIVLGQVIGMIKALRVGGNFIMKVFSCTKVCL